ncbi:MAG: hypothetical protein ACQER9_02765 [Nanobdellota archaeon]
MIYRLFLVLMTLLLLSGCTKEPFSHEFSIEETLIFQGIDANVSYTDKTVFVQYDLPIERKHDLILANMYIFSVANVYYPDSKYSLSYQDSLYSEIDGEYVTKYLNGEITLEEFQEKLIVYEI